MNVRILGFALCVLALVAVSAGADVVAEFTHGNDDATYVDAYHGIAGDGWTSPWVENFNNVANGASTTGVVSTTELYAGGGSYLSTALAASATTTNVQYALGREHADVSMAGAQMMQSIEFYFRIDEDLTRVDELMQPIFGSSATDRYQLFGGPAGANTASSGSTWQVHGYSVATGNCPVGCEKEWSFVNGGGAGSLTPEMAVNTDVPLIGGANYYFKIGFRPNEKKWDGFVTTTVGGTTYSYDSRGDFPNGLGFRNNTGTDRWLYFSSRADDDTDAREFSVDGVRIVPLGVGNREKVEAHFTDGNSTTAVDGFPGVAGLGWRDAWQVRASTGGSVVGTAMTSSDIGYSELKPGQSGTYLKVDATHEAEDSYTGLTRNYKAFGDGLDWTKKHSIQFSVRIDEDLIANFNTVDDRYQFSDISNGFNADESATWTVACYGGSDDVIASADDIGVWTFYDGDRDGGARLAENNVASTIAVVAGQVYDFTIIVDPESESYIGSVSNGTDTFTTGTLGWRTSRTDVIGGYLCFDTRAGGVMGTEVRSFSLDDVVITHLPDVQVPGDATGDGYVDAADAAALATNWGTASGATRAMGDFNGDGAVGAADASILAANWNPAPPAESTGVPEPGVVVLLAAGLAAMVLRRNR